MNESIIFGDFLQNSFQVFRDPLFSATGFLNGSYFETSDDEPLIKYDETFGALEKALSVQKSKSLFLVGAFSYELGNIIESIETSIPPSGFPIYSIYAFKNPVTEGRLQIEKQLLKIEECKQSSNLHELEEYSNFSKVAYIEAIASIKNSILEGDVYQVNLSQQFTLPYTMSSFDFFLNLQRAHPSTYCCYFPIRTRSKNYGTIVSHSPELFVKKTGSKISTKPIKGTRRRGFNQIEDEQLKMDLKNSNKDHSELSMIVDIERNDLGKICEIGSVKVNSHADLIERSNVYHLESEISGELRKTIDFIDILKALFPCGSITGAPKIAAQNIIAKTEKTNREIYTGAIGVIYPNADILLNVAIRSCLFNNNTMKFNSGGGIVHQSNAEDEWLETLYKAKGLFETWKKTVL